MRSFLKRNLISLDLATPQGQFSLFASLVLLSLFAGIASGQFFLIGLPAFLLLVFLTLVDFRKVFYLLLICIPLSSEVHLSNGFGTDLPTEPLMLGIMLVYFLHLIRYGKETNVAFFKHPITLLLLLHLSWIFCTTLTSDSSLFPLNTPWRKLGMSSLFILWRAS